MYIEKVEDLKKGDEILFPAGSNIVHAILLRDPVKTDSDWYKRTKCSVCARIEQSDRSWYNWQTKKTEVRKSNHTVYEKDIINGPRIDKYLDLQDYKMIWLLNRK